MNPLAVEERAVAAAVDNLKLAVLAGDFAMSAADLFAVNLDFVFGTAADRSAPIGGEDEFSPFTGSLFYNQKSLHR